MFSTLVRLVSLVFLLVCAGSVAAIAEPLAGTKPLEGERDYASDMVDGIDRFLLGQTEQAAGNGRSSGSATSRRRQAYAQVGRAEPGAAREDPRRGGRAGAAGALGAGRDDDAAGARRPRAGFEAFAVRWPVLQGVHGEGLLLEPDGRAVGATSSPCRTPTRRRR